MERGSVRGVAEKRKGAAQYELEVVVRRLERSIMQRGREKLTTVVAGCELSPSCWHFKGEMEPNAA